MSVQVGSGSEECLRPEVAPTRFAFFVDPIADLGMLESSSDKDMRSDCVPRNTVLAGDVLWRMFWLQGVVGEPKKDDGARIDAEARLATAFEAGDPPSHGERALIEEEALDRCIRAHIGDSTREKSVPFLRASFVEMSRVDQESLQEQAREESREAQSRWVPPTAEERRRSLAGYDVGQQDIGGRPLLIESSPSNLQNLWRTLSWVRGTQFFIFQMLIGQWAGFVCSYPAFPVCAVDYTR